MRLLIFQFHQDLLTTLDEYSSIDLYIQSSHQRLELLSLIIYSFSLLKVYHKASRFHFMNIL